MTDTEIAATLRQAVRNGILDGWKHLPDNTWLVNPQTGPCHAKTPVDVRAYCRMLNTAGITPPCTGPSDAPSPQSREPDTSSSTPN